MLQGRLEQQDRNSDILFLGKVESYVVNFISRQVYKRDPTFGDESDFSNP